ncbi:Aste57867_11801 [Aphanomyces stellatus]|uniref:RNA-dependent RNA polymerase n=1 Tax=Aphanomyces stellatus TaxID=120398 RepID=A0A485KTY2_9STRA|nr:hypothetical protein As57867_011756 [Aphanomyces stellatus]VFT88656.1 Aste57867_11801 [Aphanomyces stellatus]
MLRHGLSLNGGPAYHLVGLSNSQLRHAGFLFCVGEDNLVEAHFVLDPHTLARKTPAKLEKHVGLLFSSCRLVTLPPDTTISTIDDVERNGLCFTDGCGVISLGLAQHLSLQLKLPVCPSVWQVRYCGHGGVWKGMLVVDYTASQDCTIAFRPSQRKLSTLDSMGTPSSADLFLRTSLGVIGTSVRSKEANLNTQLITLLSVHVPRQVFLDLTLASGGDGDCKACLQRVWWRSVTGLELYESRCWSNEKTCIKFVTDGLLLNELRRDPHASCWTKCTSAARTRM